MLAKDLIARLQQFSPDTEIKFLAFSDNQKSHLCKNLDFYGLAGEPNTAILAPQIGSLMQVLNPQHTSTGTITETSQTIEPEETPRVTPGAIPSPKDLENGDNCVIDITSFGTGGKK